MLAGLPSVEHIGAVMALCSLCGGVAGYVAGALAEAIAWALGNTAEWADILWGRGLVWGAFAGGIYYFFQWRGWA
jgi:hypothetical protein